MSELRCLLSVPPFRCQLRLILPPAAVPVVCLEGHLTLVFSLQTAFLVGNLLADSICCWFLGLLVLCGVCAHVFTHVRVHVYVEQRITF